MSVAIGLSTGFLNLLGGALDLFPYELLLQGESGCVANKESLFPHVGLFCSPLFPPLFGSPFPLEVIPGA